MQLRKRPVQHLLAQAPRQALQHIVHVIALGNRAAGAGQLGRTPVFGLGIELLNQRHAAALVHPVHKALHTGVHNRFGLRHRGLAAGLGGLHHAGQVVHGVQVHIAQGFHLGFNIARHGQVDHEHGAVLALLDGTLHRTQANDGQGAGGATDDRVKFVQTDRADRPGA